MALGTSWCNEQGERQIPESLVLNNLETMDKTCIVFWDEFLSCFLAGFDPLKVSKKNERFLSKKADRWMPRDAWVSDDKIFITVGFCLNAPASPTTQNPNVDNSDSGGGSVGGGNP